MNLNQIKDEYSKQTIQLTNKQIVNVFNEEVFIKAVESSLNEFKFDEASEIQSPLTTNTNLVLMFFTHKQPETLYRTLPLILSKNKKRCYLNDIFIGVVDISHTKFIQSSMKYLLKPNSKVVVTFPITTNILSDVGKHFVSLNTLGAENLNNPEVLNSSETSAQDSTGVEDTLSELLNAHETTGSENQQKDEPVTFVERQASLTEVTADVAEKVKSGINTVATAVDVISKKQNVYIILERRYLEENKAIQIYHIYANKHLVASTLADEFAPIIISLVNRGQVRIKEVEEIVTQQGEWEAPKKL